MFSLFSGGLGFLTSMAPKIFEHFQDKRDKAHEIEMMIKTAEAQLKAEQVKLEDTYINAQVSDAVSTREHDASIHKKASTWTASLSASVRPVITYAFFLEFVLLSIALFTGWIDEATYQIIWSEEMHALFSLILAFWFGNRLFGSKAGGK